MSEFRIHHLMIDLIQSLGSKGGPEEYLDLIQKQLGENKINNYVHSPLLTHVQSLTKKCSDPQLFLDKFEEIKDRNVDGLGPFIELLDKISQDSSLKSFLNKTSKKRNIAGTNITTADLPQVRNRLLKAVAESASQLTSSARAGSLRNGTSVSVVSAPSLVSWVQRKPSMSWDFVLNTGTPSIIGSISNIPPESQENILIEDLLNILMGLSGNYIEALPLVDACANREFKISENIDLSLKELVKKILPLASHYSMVQRFMEEKMRFEFGQVNNALADCIANLTIDYTLFLTQLETEYRNRNLSLHKMWFYVQDNLHSMGIMANIAATISKSNAIGGKVLSLLHENTTEFIGDVKARELCLHLMEAACKPYMKMLGMWIYKGIISDPFKEFLVEDNEIVQKEELPIDYSADYWEKKYTVRRERIPVFLESVASMILRAGKYLNVIRQCGKSLNAKVERIEYKVKESHYIEAIEKAYAVASQTLLLLVMKEKDLMGRLSSVKHYFLLDQGDFFVTLFSLCEKELGKDVKNVVQGRLEALLDLALRMSSAVNDPYKDDMRTELLPYDLQFQMFKILSIQTDEERDYWSPTQRRSLTVIESFSFSYDVHWPLSLILNRKSLACYQMIFRHLFYCKYIERMICQVWRSNKVAKVYPMSSAAQYRNAFALRQRMLHCVQNLEYHMMVEVIEPHWNSFVQSINKVQNVDEILTCHCDFLDTCLKDCMLTIPALLSTITKLLTICQTFCKFMQRIQRHSVEAELGGLPSSAYDSFYQSEAPNQGNPPESSSDHVESFEQSIASLDLQFSTALMGLLDQINELGRDTSNDRLFNLLYRLDFNGYYSSYFEKIGLSKTVNQESSG